MGYDICVYIIYGIKLDYTKINQMRDLHKLEDLARKNSGLHAFRFDINQNSGPEFLGYKYNLEKNPDIVSGGNLGPEVYSIPDLNNLKHTYDEFLTHMAQVCGVEPKYYIFQEVGY